MGEINEQNFNIESVLSNPTLVVSVATDVVELALGSKHLQLSIFDDISGNKKENFLRAEGVDEEDLGIEGNLFV
jgi:hypothetical protein